MQLRTARLSRLLKLPAQCNSLTHGLPVYVPIVAGRSYAVMRLVKDPFKKDTSRKNNGQLKFTHKPREWSEFTLDDVPEPKDLKAMLQHPAAPPYLKGMTTAQAHGLLTEYAERILEYRNALRTRPHGLVTEYSQRVQTHNAEATQWPWVLKGLMRGDAANKPAVLATLHSLACVLMFTPVGGQWRLALDILRDLGSFEKYAPSDLTMARLAHATGRTKNRMFVEPVERVTTGRVPCETDGDRANYQTLRGLFCASAAPTEQAARDALWWFQRALDPQKGRRAPGAFDWQAECLVEMGRCYKRVGDVRHAVKVWELAARELDNPHAANLFAGATMKDRDPAKEEWLMRAAGAGGDRTAQTGLARIQKTKWADAVSQGVKGWELTFRKVMKDEWANLATDMPQRRV